MRYSSGMRILAFMGPMVHYSSGGMDGDPGGGNDSDADGDDDGSDDGNKDGVDDKGTITDDKGFDPAKFWGDDPPQKPDAPGEKNQDENKPDPAQAKIASDLKSAIEGISIPEDMIPEDFNPQDAKQFRTVLAAALQQNTRTTLQLAFTPIKAALSSMRGEIMAEVEAKVAGGITSNTGRQLLENEIDIASDPRFKATVDHIYGQAIKKSKGDPRAAVDLVKKNLKAMQLDFKPRVGQNRNSAVGEEGGTYRTGASALDAFAKIPAPNRTARQNLQR